MIAHRYLHLLIDTQLTIQISIQCHQFFLLGIVYAILLCVELVSGPDRLQELLLRVVLRLPRSGLFVSEIVCSECVSTSECLFGHQSTVQVIVPVVLVVGATGPGLVNA